MTGRRRAVLGMGSNLGDRAFHLRAAVAALGEEAVAVSDVYETEPVGGPEQGAFLNLVVVLDTARRPHELLDVARRLESAAERLRLERWGPRTLDVDVLWVDGEAVDAPDLVVPHPRMFERDFVLAPLADVAGDLVPADWDGPDAGVVRVGRLDGDLPDAGPDLARATDRRRRLIEAALDIHPDLYLDQLSATFAASGLGLVDEATLVGDLGALGFEVDDGVPDDDAADQPVDEAEAEAADEVGDGSAAPDPAEDGADAPASVALAKGAGTAPADADRGDDETEDGPPKAAAASPLARLAAQLAAHDGATAEAAAAPGDDADDGADGVAPRPVTDAFADDLRSPGAATGRRSLFGIDRTVVAAALVALVVVVVAFTLAAVGDDGEASDDTLAAMPTVAPNLGSGSEPVDGPATTAAVAPVGPGADPALVDGGDASLAFDDDLDGVPPLGDLDWTVAAGSFSAVDGRLVATPVEGGAGALATVDTGTRALRFELALPDASAGVGVAFGVADDGSYLLWAPAPGFPTVALYEVRDGQAEFLLNGEVIEVDRGARIGVHLVDGQVELLVGGAVVATYTDDSGSTRVGVGLHPTVPFGVVDDVVWAAEG